MINTIESYTHKYTQFLLDEAYENKKLFIELKEICGEEEIISVNESLISLQEASLENLKTFMDKVIDAISKAVGNFVAFIQKASGNDKKLLQSKEGIAALAKPAASGATINNWYDYNFELMYQNVPQFNEQTVMINVDNYNSKDAFFKHYPGIFDGAGSKLDDESIIDFVKKKYRGNKRDIPTEQITSDMINKMSAFIIADYTKLKDSIGEDLKQVQGLTNKLASIAKSVQKTPNKPEMESPKKESTINLESTLKLYFDEADGPTITNDEKPKETPQDNNQNNDSKKDDRKDASDAAKYYTQVVSDIVSCKMSIGAEIYKIYMKFLRWHIKKCSESNNSQTDNQNSTPTENQNTGNNGNASNKINDVINRVLK